MQQVLLLIIAAVIVIMVLVFIMVIGAIAVIVIMVLVILILAVQVPSATGLVPRYEPGASPGGAFWNGDRVVQVDARQDVPSADHREVGPARQVPGAACPAVPDRQDLQVLYPLDPPLPHSLRSQDVVRVRVQAPLCRIHREVGPARQVPGAACPAVPDRQAPAGPLTPLDHSSAPLVLQLPRIMRVKIRKSLPGVPRNAPQFVVLGDGCRVGQAELSELRASVRVRQDQDLPVLCLDGSPVVERALTERVLAHSGDALVSSAAPCHQLLQAVQRPQRPCGCQVGVVVQELPEQRARDVFCHAQ